MNQSLTALLQDGLNSQQRKAVEQEQGSLLIIAGAGSGKTRVITARIAHLIVNKGVDPSSIVALTFTNKAAKEMLERVSTFLPAGTPLPFIGTFHAYCLRFLKKHHHLLARPFVSMLDEDDRQKLLHSIIQRANLSKSTTVKQIAPFLSQVKNCATTSAEIAQALMHDEIILSIYKAYEAEKRTSQCLDFDDLLLETVALLRNNKPALYSWRSQIKHLLVDEYQDTNSIQHALLKELALSDKKMHVESVCVVGDEDQSIYSWRGATVANIAHFTRDFPDTQIIKIEQNYRSVEPILTVANHVISHNTQRHPKNLWSERKGKDRIRVISCSSDRQEAELIAQCMQVARSARSLDSYAVLYRAHFQSRSLEEALIKNSIPYRIVGGIQFYERKEIKDILAYLKLRVNPHDRVSFFRVINCPPRGLGEQFETVFRDRWHDEPFLSYQAMARHLIDQHVFTGVRRAALESFMLILEQCKLTDKPLVAVESILTQTGYNAYLHSSCDKEELVERHENIKELCRALEQFESQGITTIQAFLDEVSLMQEHASKDNLETNPVLLMTMHAAKGLEFDLVAIAGLEEGVLPSSRSFYAADSLQEERRLCYVGITRAKNYLLLSYCRYRYTYGQTNEQIRSRFIDEMPKELTPLQDCAYSSLFQSLDMFTDWLRGGTSSRPAKKVHKAPDIEKKVSRKQEVVPQEVFKAAKQSKKSIPVTPCPFKKYQTVQHCKFGLGVIQSIETREGDTAIAQVKFSDCIKKISVAFLTIQ